MTKYITNLNIGNNYLDEAIENYLMYGLQPGGFLKSVLANDLYLAVQRADHWNKSALAEIVNAIYFNVPAQAIGSYQCVDDWCRDVGGRRSQYATRKEQEYVMRILKGEANAKTIQDPPF